MTRVRLLLLAALGLAPLGCGFERLRKDTRSDAGSEVVVVTVEASDWRGDPLVVAYGRLAEGESVEIGVLRTLDRPGSFDARAAAGRFVLLGFEDRDRNGRFGAGERGVLSPAFEVGGATPAEPIVLVIDAPFDPDALAEYELRRDSRVAIGELATLDDPRFAREPAQDGLWEPRTYVREHGAGIYMLEPYDPGRTPVLFIHGMGGYPQEFEPLIASLDRERFQAWVLKYPSGLPLDEIAVFADNALDQLERRYAIGNLCVVAHSMGGLVARAMLGHHGQRRDRARIGALLTLASPLDGMASAAMGTKLAPAVVPSWYDLAPGSPFLTSLYERPLPPDSEYYLLFAYLGRGADDGVVPIASQLRDEAQAEATLVAGYEAHHVGILRSASAAAQVQRALTRCRGDHQAQPRAPRVIDDASGR